MTYQQLLDLISKLGNDVSDTREHHGILFITINDCEDYDVMRYYDNPELVDELEESLEEDCEYVSDGFYGCYLVDGHKVNLCYTSDDI